MCCTDGGLDCDVPGAVEELTYLGEKCAVVGRKKKVIGEAEEAGSGCAGGVDEGTRLGSDTHPAKEKKSLVAMFFPAIAGIWGSPVGLS